MPSFKKIYSLLFLALPFSALIAQVKKIDSLKTAFKTARHDTSRYKAAFQIGKAYQTTDPDSAAHYHILARDLAVKLNDHVKKADAIKQLGWDKYINGDYENAKSHYTEAIAIATKALSNLKDSVKRRSAKLVISSATGNVGAIHYTQGNYPLAIECYLNAERMDEETGNLQGQANNFSNIGIVHRNQGNYSKAIVYYHKAIAIFEKLGNKRGLSTALGNLGVAYSEQGLESRALGYYFRALKIDRETGAEFYEAHILGNIGNVYTHLGDSAQKKGNENLARTNYLKALDYNNQATKIDEKLENKHGLSLDYSNIADLLLRLKRNKEAESYVKRAFILAEEIGSSEDLRQAHLIFSNLFEVTNQPVLALKHYKRYVALRDSIFNEENTRKTIQQELKFSYEKKATQDSIRIAGEKKIQAERIAKEKTERLALYGGLALVVLFASFMVNRFRVTNKQKKIIEEQKKLVEDKQASILDSIRYAKRIQQALLPNEKYVEKSFSRLKKTGKSNEN